MRQSQVHLKSFCGIFSFLFVMMASDTKGIDYLRPDIVTNPSYLYENYHEHKSDGTVLLWLSNGTSNVGAGQLYLYGILPANPDGSQDVKQRIFDSTGQNYIDTLVGRFIYHQEHQHIHFEDWAIYRIRQIDWVSDPQNGVGAIVSEGDKTSFCIEDMYRLNPPLPNSPASAVFHSCDTTVQGLSIGWEDVYVALLPGQFVDITNVPNGLYWLESQADPDNNVLESNENNNTARIQVQVIHKDAYEPNNSTGQVDPMLWGGTNSSNFGPCDNSPRIVSVVNIHPELWDMKDYDVYKFKMYSTGQSQHFVEIVFEQAQGDIDMQLLNSSGATIATSYGTTGDEYISLSGRPAGWYYVRVFPKLDFVGNPGYLLAVFAPSNEKCGDVNGDGSVTLADVVALNNYLNGSHANCPNNGDVNGDCQVDQNDRTYLINYIFYGGPPPDGDCSC